MKEPLSHILKESTRYSLAVLFILGVLQPFGIDQMEHRLAYLFGVAVMEFFIKIVILTAASPIRNKKVQLPVRYTVHLLLFSAMLLTFNSYFYAGNLTEFWTGKWSGGDPDKFDLTLYFEACKWVLLVSLIIAIYDIYRMRNNRLRLELEEVRAINALLEQRASQDETEDDEPVSVSSEEDDDEVAENSVCAIKGNAVNDLFEVSPKEILYIESLSNYADIWYLHEGERLHHIIRTTMKQLREQLAEVDYLISCHRAYIININYAVSLTSRTSGNYQLQMLGIDKLIPVSRANTVEIKRALQK